MARIVFDSDTRPSIRGKVLKALSDAIASGNLATVYAVAIQGGKPTAHFARIAGDVLEKREKEGDAIALLKGLLSFHRKEKK